MSALVLSLVLHAWGPSEAIRVDVGQSVTVELPGTLRFVSVGGGDVVDVGVSRDLRRLSVKGLRKGTRTVVAHFTDRTRVTLELTVSPKHRAGRR